jgi:hypothetical protein|tara:strand:+ start:412 stop:606 length:195 start_codon:yes stop_codon:yes gene_type:complete
MKLALRPTFKFFNQEKTIFGKKINFDMTKDLKDQDWLKSDLFSSIEKDFIIQVGSKIKMIEEIE